MERLLKFLLYASVFTPLIVAHGMFFPFIVGKMLAFEAIVLASALIWLYLWSKNPARYSPHITWLTLAIGIYIIVNFAAALQGANFWRSFWSNFERMDGIFTWMSFFLFFLVLSGVFKKSEEWIMLFRASLLASIIIGLQALRFFGIFAGDFTIPTQISAIFGSPIYLGVYALFHIAIALLLFRSLGHVVRASRDFLPLLKNRWALYYAFGILLNTLILFLTFARAVTAGFLAGIAVFTLWYLLFGGEKKLILKGLGTLLILLLITFPFWQESPLAKRLYSLSGGLFSDETRVINWSVGFNAFKDRPLLGWGMNNYVVAQNEFYNPRLAELIQEGFDKPHNKYIEVAIDSGIAGFTAYAGIFVLVFFTLFKYRKEEPLITASLAAVLAGYLIQNLTAFDNPGSYMPFFLVLAFMHFKFFSQAIAEVRPNSALILVSALLILVFIWQGVWQPYRANVTLSKVLSLQQRTTKDYANITAGYQKALSYQTFGDNEIRSRLGVFAANNPEITEELVDLAIEESQREIAIADNEVKFHLILGNLYERKGDAQKEGGSEFLANAQAHLLRALELSPRRTETHGHYITFLINRGKMEEARSEILKVKEINEEIFAGREIQWYLGVTYFAEKKYKEAYDHFQEMQKNGVQFSSEQELLVLAQTASELEEYEQMVKWYEELYRTDTDNPLYSLYLAEAYRDVGNAGGAKDFVKRAVRLNPDLAQEAGEFLKSLE